MAERTKQKSPQELIAQEIVREPIDKPSAQRPVGRVFIIPERCKECKYCWEYCPEGILEASPAVNSHGYHYPQIRHGKESDCIVCGMCERICPDQAIFAAEARPLTGITSRIRTIRWASQLGFLVLFLFLTTGAVCAVVIGRGFAIPEPLGILQLVFGQVLANRSLSFITTTVIIGLAVFVGATLLVGKAFCSWACPVGTVIDLVDSGIERSKFKPFFARRTHFNGINNSNGLIRNGMSKYAVLGSTLAGSALLNTPIWCAFCPIGTICRGAIAGPELTIGAEILTVPAVAGMGLAEKRFWCKYLCPVGGLLTLLGKYSVFIKPRLRNGRRLNCGLCPTICPEGINLCQEESYARCSKCLDCYTKCPSGAVKIDLT
jgi:polyferredoxin